MTQNNQFTDGNNISKVYEPQSFEKKWYKFWEENNLFHEPTDESRKPFSIVMPPPNVTGQLHMGHAMDNTLQDILIRFRRMQGYNTLWVPGTDHAGIATQAKVDAALRQEGKSRFDIGREEFLKRAWAWKEQYGNTIKNQIRSLGASCDWTRERFTMDEGCSHAVHEVFVRLYDKGLIYRGNRIANYCPSCNTVISDIEVDHKDEHGFLYFIKYPIEGENEYVEIATTRPETMFGDVAVAVNPEDERYSELIGKKLILPIVNRQIPVIADSYVDKDFGTGVVKITPAHDPNDFEMGERHNLDQIVVMNNDATMNSAAGKYEGLDRYECRNRLVEDLKENGYLLKVEEHDHAVGHCSRCGTTLEPLVSKQWYIKMESLAEPARKVVEEGKIKFVPERFTKTYCNWLSEIRDWCISRQLWWGHRIPAWYCDDCGEIVVANNDVHECPHCRGNNLHQDEDVLDTWFSSALWPFEVMGWPNETPELKQFYPTSVLVTGYDIIFFWVARMVMMGLEFGKDIPFDTVFIHGLVRDSQGRKMSKSLGNGIDPVEVINKYGADTLRFMLITGNTPGNDMRFYWERVESARNFANKLWNASRFMLMNLEGFDGNFTPEYKDFTLADKWILSRFNKIASHVTNNLEKFELGEAGRSIYDFIWNELCDWYIELSKARLYYKENIEDRKTAQYVLHYVLESSLRLLHPFMPFITEEIWQHIPHEGQSIMLSKWPLINGEFSNDKAELEMILIMNTIKAIRNLRAEVNAAPSNKTEVILHCQAKEIMDIFVTNDNYLKSLASALEVKSQIFGSDKPENAMTAVVDGVEIYIPLKGLIDVEKEEQRLSKELDTLNKEVIRLEKKLSNESFRAKAPADIVSKEEEKLSGYKDKRNVVENRINYLKELSQK